MEEIRQSDLPGVGRCYEYATAAGQRVGVVVRSSGRRDLVVYAEDDPDAVVESVDMSLDEAQTLAAALTDQPLGTARASLAAVIDGVAVDWRSVPEGFGSRTIGDLQIRSRTGASVVAVVRDGEVDPAPAPDRVIDSRDTVVVLGTPDAIADVFALFETG
ncbi:MAG: potassium transporter TrkA [Acidimicrobiia bacterium]|nr:potassium transporter TrkA [Acidimicrobiia bacterium]